MLIADPRFAHGISESWSLRRSPSSMTEETCVRIYEMTYLVRRKLARRAFTEFFYLERLFAAYA
jgi:hypothetical protein